MDSEFFIDGYEVRKEIAHLDARIDELTVEMKEDLQSETGRSKKHIEEEIDELLKKKTELLSKLPHEEDPTE